MQGDLETLTVPRYTGRTCINAHEDSSTEKGITILSRKRTKNRKCFMPRPNRPNRPNLSDSFRSAPTFVAYRLFRDLRLFISPHSSVLLFVCIVDPLSPPDDVADFPTFRSGTLP
jgi:hypothetical protein